MNVRESGFTLIELIAVIVILGILSAVALPKFIDLARDARLAKLDAAIGAMNSAMSMTHGKFLVNPVSPQLFEGSTVTFAFAFPDAASIADIAGLLAPDYSASVTGDVMTVSVVTNCTATYTQASSAIIPPVIEIGVTTGC